MSTGAAAMVGCDGVGAVVCVDDVVDEGAGLLVDPDASDVEEGAEVSVDRSVEESVHDRRLRRTAGRNPSSPTEATAGTRASPPTRSIGRA